MTIQSSASATVEMLLSDDIIEGQRSGGKQYKAPIDRPCGLGCSRVFFVTLPKCFLKESKGFEGWNPGLAGGE